MNPEIVQIDLSNLDAAELALLCKMTHIDVRVRYTAKDMLEAQVGSNICQQLQAEALKAYEHVSALDAALYAESAK